MALVALSHETEMSNFVHFQRATWYGKTRPCAGSWGGWRRGGVRASELPRARQFLSPVVRTDSATARRGLRRGRCWREAGHWRPSPLRTTRSPSRPQTFIDVFVNCIVIVVIIHFKIFYLILFFCSRCFLAKS